MREIVTEEPPPSHAKVQHVYALDVLELGDRLGVSQQELVDGIARDHDHIALQQVLERLVAHQESEPQQQELVGKQRKEPGVGDSDDDRVGKDEKICREACLLLLPPKDATSSSSGAKDRRVASLTKLEDGRTVLEHMLHELFQPKLIEHLVICLPASSSSTASSRSYSQLKKMGARLCAVAKVQVDFVEIALEDGDQNEVRAIQTASRCFLGDGALQRRHPSDGFLVLRGDRIFDAPTIQMMAVATGSTMSPSSGSITGRERDVRLRALVDLDVELSGDDEDESSEAPYAGIFALIGKAAAIADRLEQKHAPQTTATTLNALLVASTTKGDNDNGSEVALSVEKVVASDYCSWRKVARDDNNQELQSVGRHTMSSFHSRKRQTYNTSSSSSEHSQQSYEYYEFPRERSPSLSRGYHGFKVDTKHAMVREPESTRQQQVSQSTSERNPLLAVKTVDSDLMSDDDYLSAAEAGEDDGDVEFGTETTVLTEADFDAMLEAKNRAFLFQVSSDLHHPCISPIDTSNSSRVEQKQRLERHDDDVVFLALPDTDGYHHHPSTAADKDHQFPTHQGLSLRRFSQLPSDVQEIRMEAVVLQQSGASKTKTKGISAVSVNVVVKKQVPVVGYVILLTALCAISSQGAVQDLLVDVPPLLKVFWRMTGASMAFAPLAVASLWQNNWAFPVLTARKKALFALCGVSYAIYNATFIIALSLTSVGHTYIFTNCHSLLMVLAKFVLGQPLGVLELVGAGIGFSGGVITTMDSAEQVSSSTANVTHLGHKPSTLGDMIAFAGAFAGVGYLMSAKRVRPTMGVFVFMWTLVTTVAVLVLLVLLWNRESLGIANDTHATHGLFGWVRHLGIEAYVVFVGSFAGTMGFVTSLKYFDPLVVSVTMLTEPVVATIFGICVGVDRVPGSLTFLGSVAVLTGCSLVMLASHKTCAKVDVSDALVVPSGAAQRLEHAGGLKSQRRRHSTFHHRQQQHLQKSSSFRVNYGSFP